MKKPITPWIPMSVSEGNDLCAVSMWDRTYTVDKNVLFTSIVSRGNEILNAPIRLVGLENGEEIVWKEQSPFVMSANEEQVTLCCSQESSAFIVNTALKTDFDGYCDMDIKIMPRGRTVAEVFGVDKVKPNEYSLDRLWLEIPLKKEYFSLFHYYPAAPIPTFEDESRGFQLSSVCMSRAIPCSMKLPFKPLLWLGNERQGLCWCADSNENWEPADENNAIEIVDGKDEVLLRFHLIDKTVEAWKPIEGRPKNYTYPPLSFKMALQATPVKPFATNPYKEKILHIDCFKKILEEYDDFLAKPVVEGSTEIGYDRMKRLGVTTLVIHEKWNKVQNYWELSKPTEKLARTIVAECHKRGIKVIPYFGYELSTLNPKYSEYATSRSLHPCGAYAGGWYRKPNQRAYSLCFNSRYAKDMAEGIKKLTEEYDFDGVYLDSTLYPTPCINASHGCGYTDRNGNIRPTYNITALRNFMKNVYEYFESLGKMVNPHLSNCCNIPALSFSHLNWDGEHSQSYINANGIDKIPLDYMRTEYSARNFGIPYEYLAYTFDNWSFEDSLSIGLIHGMLSRPNDIGKPLEVISLIWKAVDSFPIESAEWNPYWENGVLPEESKVKVSFYKAEGKTPEYLVFVANPSDSDNQTVTLDFIGKQTHIFSVSKQSEISATITLNARKSDVLLVK